MPPTDTAPTTPCGPTPDWKSEGIHRAKMQMRKGATQTVFVQAGSTCNRAARNASGLGVSLGAPLPLVVALTDGASDQSRAQRKRSLGSQSWDHGLDGGNEDSCSCVDSCPFVVRLLCMPPRMVMSVCESRL